MVVVTEIVVAMTTKIIHSSQHFCQELVQSVNYFLKITGEAWIWLQLNRWSGFEVLSEDSSTALTVV